MRIIIALLITCISACASQRALIGVDAGMSVDSVFPGVSSSESETVSGNERLQTKVDAFPQQSAGKEAVVSLPGGLQYRVIRDGGGVSPTLSDTVTVQYRGMLLDGEEFDSSYRNEGQVTFPLGQVLPGWQEALRGMQEGALWELYIPSALAYGKWQPREGQTIILEVALLSVHTAGSPESDTASARARTVEETRATRDALTGTVVSTVSTMPDATSVSASTIAGSPASVPVPTTSTPYSWPESLQAVVTRPQEELWAAESYPPPVAAAPASNVPDDRFFHPDSAVAHDRVIAADPVGHQPRMRSKPSQVTLVQEDESVTIESTYKGGNLFTLGTAFTQQSRIDELTASPSQQSGLWSLKLNSGSGKRGPGFAAEFAMSSFDPHTSERFGASKHRMMKLATETSWAGFGLGATYQSIGNNFGDEDDAGGHKKLTSNREDTDGEGGVDGSEFWMSRQFGNLGLKTVASLYQSKPDDDDSLPLFRTRKLGGSLNYLFSSWPQIGVTFGYASGLRESLSEPDSMEGMAVDVGEIEASLNYAGSSWSGTLYAGQFKGGGDTTDVTDVRTYYAGGSYQPFSTVSVSPGISFVQEKYPEFDVSTDSVSTSMDISYQPAKSDYSFSSYSEYSTERNLGWETDTEYLYTSMGVNWAAKNPDSFIKQWSLELFYDQYIDNVYSDSNTGGPGFWLRLRSSPSPMKRFVNEIR